MLGSYVPGQIPRHEPVAFMCSQTHDYDIGDHLLNSAACRTDYSPKFTVLHRAQIRLQLNIFEYVPINIKCIALFRQREFKHKLPLFGETVANLTPNKENIFFLFPL